MRFARETRPWDGTVMVEALAMEGIGSSRPRRREATTEVFRPEVKSGRPEKQPPYDDRGVDKRGQVCANVRSAARFCNTPTTFLHSM